MLLPLTSIRGIAAWWVVLFHLRFLLQPWIPTPVFALLGRGNLAVDLFFVLSGFVIALNYGGRPGRDWASLRDFLFRRFARVYPLHLLMLLAFAAYAGAAVTFGGTLLEAQDPGYFLSSLLLIQNWGFYDVLRWNVPAWSISAEFFAYLLFPALIGIAAPRRRATWVLVVSVLLLGLAIQAAFWWLRLPYPWAVTQTGLLRCVVQFTMGVLLCELYRRGQGASRPAPALLLTAALLGAAYAAFEAPVMPLAWASLVLGLAFVRGGALSSPPAVWLGRVSYATYLSHYFLLTLFKYAFVEPGRPIAPALLLLYVMSVLGASALLHHGFERPAQRRLMAWWRARAAQPPALAPAE